MWASERPSWFSTNALTLLLGEKIAAQRGQSFLEGHTAQDPKFPAFYLSLLTAPCYSQENEPTCTLSPPTWISRKSKPWLYLLLQILRSTQRVQGHLPSNVVPVHIYEGSNQSIQTFQIQKQSLIKGNCLSPLQFQTSLSNRQIQPSGQEFPVRSFMAFTLKEVAFDLC